MIGTINIRGGLTSPTWRFADQLCCSHFKCVTAFVSNITYYIGDINHLGFMSSKNLFTIKKCKCNVKVLLFINQLNYLLK